MSEQFISSHEEQNAATMAHMHESIRTRTPEEAASRLEDGIDDLTGVELQKNRDFYSRMKGVAALRATVEMQHSDEVFATARQLYGPLGYDSTPRSIRKM